MSKRSMPGCMDELEIVGHPSLVVKILTSISVTSYIAILYSTNLRSSIQNEEKCWFNAVWEYLKAFLADFFLYYINVYLNISLLEQGRVEKKKKPSR